MQSMSGQVESALRIDTTPGPAGRLGRRLRAVKPAIPAEPNPRDELRRLVHEHQNMTRKSVAMRAMASDRKNLTTGETIKCSLPLDRQAEVKAVAKAIAADASRLETGMLRELRKVPIYSRWLVNVYGVGPVVAAYMVANIDVGDFVDKVTGEVRSRKPSQVKRFCGLAVFNGRLERPTKGQKLGYCAEMRTRLFQAMTAGWKNAARKTTDRPNGATSKYLTIWHDTIHRETSAQRKGGFKKGLWKAADILIADLYTVWRALDGLPVWPSYMAAKLGYEHGGVSIADQGPRLLTVEEALAFVGDPSGRAADAPLPEVADTELDDLDEETAE